MKFFKLTDVILIIALLAAAFFAHRALSGGSQTIAQITVDGNVVDQINLKTVNENYFLEFNNVSIEVSPGGICFVKSSCRDKTCTRAGVLASPGDFAACLPNKVAIKIVGLQGHDAVTG